MTPGRSGDSPGYTSQVPYRSVKIASIRCPCDCRSQARPGFSLRPTETVLTNSLIANSRDRTAPTLLGTIKDSNCCAGKQYENKLCMRRLTGCRWKVTLLVRSFSSSEVSNCRLQIYRATGSWVQRLRKSGHYKKTKLL